MITVKSKANIDSMKKAGIILRDTLCLLEEKAKVGVSTYELDKIAYEYIKSQNAVPSFYKYEGFPATICASIDDEVVHGIPSKKRILEEGMLLKVDCGAGIEGFHTDAARTIAIGEVSAEKKRLMDVCKQSFFEGMKVLKDGVRLGTLGSTIQSYVESNGYSVIRPLVGHGIGTTVHEDPDVPNYGKEGRGQRVCTNMTIAVEPMISYCDEDVYQEDNGWTYVTESNSIAAHYENTVVITDDGVEIITL